MVSSYVLPFVHHKLLCGSLGSFEPYFYNYLFVCLPKPLTGSEVRYHGTAFSNKDVWSKYNLVFILLVLILILNNFQANVLSYSF